MSSEEEALHQQLHWVKYRIQILELIEEKLKEIRSLALQIRDTRPDRTETIRIQDRVNELMTEIRELEQSLYVKGLH